MLVLPPPAMKFSQSFVLLVFLAVGVLSLQGVALASDGFCCVTRGSDCVAGYTLSVCKAEKGVRFDLNGDACSVACHMPLPGGDRDEHGCIPSAGYSWCDATQKCIRPWEESCPGGLWGEAPVATYADHVLTAPEFFRNPFTDTSLSTTAGKAAMELSRRGVISGFPDGTFRGSLSVNRAQAAKFLLVTRYGESGDVKNDGKFSDVPDGQWFTPYVLKAARKGIIVGYGSGLFKPENPVNTAEFLKMFSRAFGLPQKLPFSYKDVKQDDWFAPYAGIAQKYSLFPLRKTLLRPDQELTRNDVAIAIYEYLKRR